MWLVLAVLIIVLLIWYFWPTETFKSRAEHIRPGPRSHGPPRGHAPYVPPPSHAYPSRVHYPSRAGYWNQMAGHRGIWPWQSWNGMPEFDTLIQSYNIDPSAVARVRAQTPFSTGVFLYRYRGQLIMLVEVSGADTMTHAYNIYGTLIGMPFGGITGRGDGKFPDWWTAAQYIGQLN